MFKSIERIKGLVHKYTESKLDVLLKGEIGSEVIVNNKYRFVKIVSEFLIHNPSRTVTLELYVLFLNILRIIVVTAHRFGLATQLTRLVEDT